MRATSALAALALTLASAYGVSRRLVGPAAGDRLTLILTTIALGLGALTLAMYAVVLLWPGRLGFGLLLAALWVAGGAAAAPYARAGATGRTDGEPIAWCPLGATLVFIVGLTGSAVIFNAWFWPFDPGDALALYAPMGRQVFQTRALPHGLGPYDAYPLLVPMAYAFTHFAYGAVDESLARLVPALMCVGAMGAAAALGRAMHSPLVGLGAAGLVALTPTFGRWASTGYADAPAGFFAALSVLHAWRWWRSGRPHEAALAGAMVGLAMWTKNSALTLAAGPFLVWGLWRLESGPDAAPRTRDLAWMAGGMLAAAAPWYARNVVTYGFLFPETAWTHLSPPGLVALGVMLRPDKHFGVPGWWLTAAIAFGLGQAWRGTRRAAWRVLLASALPFLAAWYWKASFDARFLMTVLPLLAVMGALMAAALGEALARRLPGGGRRLGVATAVLLLALAPFSLRKAVEHKWVLLERPRLSDAEKHRVRVGGLYDLAAAVNALPAGSRVVGLPMMGRYYIDTRRLGEADFARPTRPCADLADRYDYATYEGPDSENRARAGPGRVLLRTDDGYLLCATRPHPWPRAASPGATRAGAG